MPNVVLDLAGIDFTLSPYDYAMEWDVGRGQHTMRLCIFGERAGCQGDCDRLSVS